MAEYLIEDTTLTNLGDSIRGLNDTTATMTPAQMKSTVDDAVSEVGTQADLIAQITTALEGKVASAATGSSGGESAVESGTISVSLEETAPLAYDCSFDLSVVPDIDTKRIVLVYADNYAFFTAYRTDTTQSFVITRGRHIQASLGGESISGNVVTFVETTLYDDTITTANYIAI